MRQTRYNIFILAARTFVAFLYHLANFYLPFNILFG